LRQSLPVAQVLVTAPDAADVINDADIDLHRTPLHLAVRGNSAGLVKLLLEKGASASKKKQEDILGETPLDYCNFHMTSPTARGVQTGWSLRCFVANLPWEYPA
jgi:hypothetical protein